MHKLATVYNEFAIWTCVHHLFLWIPRKDKTTIIAGWTSNPNVANLLFFFFLSNPWIFFNHFSAVKRELVVVPHHPHLSFSSDTPKNSACELQTSSNTVLNLLGGALQFYFISLLCGVLQNLWPLGWSPCQPICKTINSSPLTNSCDVEIIRMWIILASLSHFPVSLCIFTCTHKRHTVHFSIVRIIMFSFLTQWWHIKKY